MKVPQMRRILAPFLIAVMLLVTACGETKAPSRWDKAQQESTQKPSKTKQIASQTPGNTQKLPSKPVTGGSLNKFFPAAGGGYDRTFTQEKAGFAEAKLKKGGKEVATLSINDVAGNPTAADKFKASTEQIGGYPAVEQGKGTTAVLVGNRYQVKVKSSDTSFSAGDRKAWLEKFNLSGLANLKK
ncbi:hypothetical protein BCD67_19985 [Oscillatoriales cyanobacterium USR001]|nr:hypothetical protein BCD67_19985 [Oscillatoriales cyanobacterium USR001]